MKLSTGNSCPRTGLNTNQPEVCFTLGPISLSHSAEPGDSHHQSDNLQVRQIHITSQGIDIKHEMTYPSASLQPCIAAENTELEEI